MGAKGVPFYRVVVADERSPRNGRFIEELGYYCLLYTSVPRYSLVGFWKRESDNCGFSFLGYNMISPFSFDP